MKDVASSSKFYFSADVVDPLVIKKWELRSESDYCADSDPESSALGYIKNVAGCFDGSVYLLTVSQHIANPNKLLYKKWGLSVDKAFPDLDCRHFKACCFDGEVRFVSLLDLGGYDYKKSSEIVLNSIYSMIVLSYVAIDDLSKCVTSWISEDKISVLPYSHTKIANSLVSLGGSAALRYFPADNGRPEELIVVGDKIFIAANVDHCMSDFSSKPM